MNHVTHYEIERYITQTFTGIKQKNKWGETSFFYNPDGPLPHGVYFITIKKQDDDNDKASNLNRKNIYRLNFGISETSFAKLFPQKILRPAKGETIKGSYDFTELNKITPHPVYGWMKWISILNPDKKIFDQQLVPLFKESYDLAVKKFYTKKS